MIIMDSMMIVIFSKFLYSIIKFMKMAKQNIAEHSEDAVASLHFQEHTLAAWFGMTGSAISLVASIFHAVYQNIIGQPVVPYIEELQSLGLVFLVISGWLFIQHMTKEETKGHPFYIREYGKTSEET